MNSNKKKLFEMLRDDTYGLCPLPMSAEFAIQILTDYLLGEDFYVAISMSQEQVNTEIVAAILDKYSKEFRKDCKKYMPKGE